MDRTLSPQLISPAKIDILIVMFGGGRRWCGLNNSITTANSLIVVTSTYRCYLFRYYSYINSTTFFAIDLCLKTMPSFLPRIAKMSLQVG